MSQISKQRIMLTDENFRVKLKEGKPDYWYQYLRMEDGHEDIDYQQLKEQILNDHEIVNRLQYYKEYPTALNYNSFVAFINYIFTGKWETKQGNGA